ncbi:MAG: hypothetical protein ACOCX2_13115 [Armatimonadota bacterium]
MIRMRLLRTMFPLALSAALTSCVNAEPIDLSDARISSTVGPGAGRIADGNEMRLWSGTDADLSEHPANLFIELGEPALVGRLDVVTDDLKGYLRLTGLEVYAQVGDAWALLGSIGEEDIEGFEADADTVTDAGHEYHLVRFSLDLLPARVETLRLRITATARPDNAFPRIHELSLHAPELGVEAADPEPAPIEDENASESYHVRAATGRIPAPPEIAYEPEVGYLGYARSFMDTMLAKGADIYGETHSPMLVSILLLDTQEHPGAELPTIVGQRHHDRAHYGGNLQHDLPLLDAMRHMSAITGDESYAEGARAYLRAFFKHCAGTPTGMWPWGEHAHWDFNEEAPGHTTHEYLGAPSLEFWEQAWEMAPEAVTAHADGLINHVVNLDTFDYNRHANIMEPLPEPRPDGLGFLDFPRHGGFFMQTWAFAWSKTGDATYLDWIERMLDHQDDTRLESGLLPSCSERSSRPTGAGLSSTFSCAVSMLESAPLLGDTQTAERVERMAQGYFEAVAEHSTIADAEPSFTAAYGAGALAGSAMLYGHAYRLTEDERFLSMARAVAEKYAEIDEIPRVRNTPAQVFGSIVNLMLDMHELDGDARWLEAAERYARTGIDRLYVDGLFRGATELWYYESELWVSNFVYALVRLHAVTEETAHTVPPTAFQR